MPKKKLPVKVRRRRNTPERSKNRLKLRAAIMDVKEKKVVLAEREKNMRAQLRRM